MQKKWHWFSEEKPTHIIEQCQEVYSQPRTSVSSLARFIGLLLSTVQAILPGKFKFCFLQQEEISNLKKEGRYQEYVNLGREYKAIQWYKNLTAGNFNAHPSRCFHKRVGSTLEWNIGRGAMVEQRTLTPNTFFRTNGREIYNPGFHKKYLKFNYSYLEWQ